MIRVLYFARLREQVGTAGEELTAGPALATVADLIKTLRQRGGRWADAFGADQTVLSAINHELAQGDQSLADGDEVAFFPPVTGG